jgi:hypothetical protein
LVINVAEAKTLGHVIPDAYGAVLSIEECREKLGDKIRDTNELHRAIDHQLARAIEKHLNRER